MYWGKPRYIEVAFCTALGVQTPVYCDRILYSNEGQIPLYCEAFLCRNEGMFNSVLRSNASLAIYVGLTIL